MVLVMMEDEGEAEMTVVIDVEFLKKIVLPDVIVEVKVMMMQEEEEEMEDTVVVVVVVNLMPALVCEVGWVRDVCAGRLVGSVV